MAELRQWLAHETDRVARPKSRIGEALRYLRNQLESLIVFLRDGRVPLDNSETEQLMKRVATEYENWFFIGSVAAGYRAAILLTIISTAHHYLLHLWQHVKDILGRLLGGERDLASLRADRWAESHPEALHRHRIDEARDRADTKSTRRRLLKRKRSGRALCR
jgi:hypothetical protein